MINKFDIVTGKLEIRWKEHCSNNGKKSEVVEHLLKKP